MEIIVDNPDWIFDKPISIFSLDAADRRVLKIADRRDAIQKKTFTKWINFHLAKRNVLLVNDLFTDLRDGHLLLTLLEIFTNQTMPRERGSSKFHSLRNLENCLESLQNDHRIRLVNIRPEDLLNGNPKLTLGLIWRIILHFQFSNADDDRTDFDKIAANYRQMLLDWAREQCQGYPGVYLEDLTHSWRNGRAFLVILHRHNPDSIEIDRIYRSSNRENLRRAFQFAQQRYGIAQLIDAEDVDNDEPDEKSLLLYIFHLYKVCSDLPTHPFEIEHDEIQYNCQAMRFLQMIERPVEQDMTNFHQILIRLKMIEKKLRNSDRHEFLQPDFVTINRLWNEFQISMENRENFLQLQRDFDEFESKLDSTDFLVSIDALKTELVQLTHSCQHVALSDSQLRFLAERIEKITGKLTEKILRSRSDEQDFPTQRIEEFREEFHFSSHQELREIIRQVSKHFDPKSSMLNLLNSTSSKIFEIENRLASHRSPISEEKDLHYQFDDLLQLDSQLVNLEKSIVDLQQIHHDGLKRLCDELTLRTKKISDEIHQRKRSIRQIIETIRSFENLLEQEERRFQTFETLTNLFNEILSRTASVDHLNDLAVKLIEELKMHEKNLRHFRLFLRLNIDQSRCQRLSREIRKKIELFDRRYANLLSSFPDESTRNCSAQLTNGTHFSLQSLIEHYRSPIGCRYDLSWDDEIHQSSDDDQKALINLSSKKVTGQRLFNEHLSSGDDLICLETIYRIPNERRSVKIRNHHQRLMSTKSTLSFIDAVNSKHLDLSTGLFSPLSPLSSSSSSSSPPSYLPFVVSSPSSFSSSTSPPLDQHFFSSLSTAQTTTTNVENTNRLSTSTSSSLAVNNHPHRPSSNITLKQAIDANLLDAQSAYIFDTLEQRFYDLRQAFSRGLINPINQLILDPIQARQLSLAEAMKMGILKVGDPLSYNVISKTESLLISSVFDHRANTFIEPNQAIRIKILDPYHGLYVNNLTQEQISIDDAMSKGFLLVEQQPSNANGHQQSTNDKYVISTSLIRETRSYHLLGVKDYLQNRELSVQDAIRAGILDKQNGQFINKKTGEIFSISEAIAQGHIRAQPLPVETIASQDVHHQQTTNGTSISNSHKRGTVKETKTYTLKSAIHPRTRHEIPIRQAIDEGIIDHAKGFYVNSLTGENLPISVAIEKGLIFTELLEPTGRRFVKTLIIEQVVDPLNNRRLGVTEAIRENLLDSSATIYHHPLTYKQMSILEAFDQGLIIGKFRDQHPSSFFGNEREQVFYLITGVIDYPTGHVYSLQESIEKGLFNHKRGVYIHPINRTEINIGEAVRQGFIQVQAVSSQISFNNIDHLSADTRRAIISHEPFGQQNDSRSKLSIRIESQTNPRKPYEIRENESFQRDKDVVEIESVQRLPRHRKSNIRHEEEIIEQRTTNVFDREIFIGGGKSTPQRARSNEPLRQQFIEEVVIDDGSNLNRRGKIDIKEERHTSHREIVIDGDRQNPPIVLPVRDHLVINGSTRQHDVRVVSSNRPQQPFIGPRPIHIDDRHEEGRRIHHGAIHIDDHHPSTTSKTSTQTNIIRDCIDISEQRTSTKQPIRVSPQPQPPSTSTTTFDEHQSWTEEEWEQWHCILMIEGKPYRVVWVMNTATGDRLPLQTAYQRGLVDTNQRLFYDEKLNRQSYSFERAVELGYMGIELDTASLPLHVDGIDYMIHWVLDSSTKRRIFPRPAVRKQILDSIHGRYVNPYNNSQVSLHEAIHLKFVGATEYNSNNDFITVTINGRTYTIKWVYDMRHPKKILPRDALKQGVIDIQLNEYRKFDTNDVMTIPEAIGAGFIRCQGDDSSSDNSVRPPSITSIDEDELTIATKTATYVITSVIHPLTQKEIKVSEAIDLGILDKTIGSYRDLATNVQYELAEAINEGLVYATIIETKEDTEMMSTSVQEIVRKFIVKSVALDSECQEKIGGLEAQAIGILNYAQGVYHDRKTGEKIPLDKAIEKKLLDVELVSQKRFEEYDLELITDTITEKRVTLYKIHGVRNNVMDRMESGAVAVKNQLIDTEAKTYTDFSTGETLTIQEAINRNLIEAEISEHVERKPLGLSMQNAIRLGFYVAETGTFRDPATEHYMTLMEAIERGHIHVNGVAFADSEQGPITLYEAFSLGLINRRDGGKLNPPKISVYRARTVESKLHRMNVEDAIRCGLLNLRTGLYKHPHSGEQLNLKDAIQRGLIDGQSTIIEHPTSGRFLTLKDALEGIRIDHEGQVIDSYSNKVITTLESAFNHRKLFSQFDVNAGEVFLPQQNESVGFEKAIRKNLLDNNRMKLFDPKTSREYTIQDAIERGLIDAESGLVYDSHSRTQYSIREAIRHGIVAIVGAPLVPIKADHETVAAKITSRKHRRHSLAKSSLHYDYNSAPDSADEDSHGSGWHRVSSKPRTMSPLSIDGRTTTTTTVSRRRTGSSPSRTYRIDDWKSNWKRDDDDDDDETKNSKRSTGTTFYSSTTTRRQYQNEDGGGKSTSTNDRNSSSGAQQKEEQFFSSTKEMNGETNLSDIHESVDRLTEWQNRLIPFTVDRNRIEKFRSNVDQVKKHLSELIGKVNDQVETGQNRWQTSSNFVNQQIILDEAPVDRISNPFNVEEGDMLSSSSSPLISFCSPSALSSTVDVIPLTEENNVNVDQEDDEQNLMHHFGLIERFLQQRQFVRNRIDEIIRWIDSIDEEKVFPTKFFLKRTKLDEQIVEFRHFNVQFRTYREIYEKDVQTRLQIAKLIDDDDRRRTNFIEKFFDKTSIVVKSYDEKISNVSQILNDFLAEHARLIENYSKSIRFASELIEKNDDFQFTELFVLFNDEKLFDEEIYENLRDELEKFGELDDEDDQLDEFRENFENLRDDLTSIVRNRHEILNEFDLMKNQIEDWLNNAENTLKHSLTIELSRQLLIEHASLPIDAFQSVAEQLIEFYSSPNLLNFYERLKFSRSSTFRSETARIYRDQTDEIVEAYRSMKTRLLQFLQLELERKAAQDAIDKAKILLRFDETPRLSLDLNEMKKIREDFQSLGDQFRSFSSFIAQFKTTATNFLDKRSAENEIKPLEKLWAECVEFFFDTTDFLQMHDEDLNEFYQLANRLLNENEFEADQIDLLNQKGELLLENSTNFETQNPVSELIETINRKYENYLKKISNSTEIQQKNLDEISSILVTSTNAIPSCRTTKLTEQFEQIKSIRDELDRIIGEIEILRDRIDVDETFAEKCRQLIEHSTIMRQTNDLREDQLFLIQTLAERFSLSYQRFINFVNRMTDELAQRIPDGNLDDEEIQFQHLVRTISQERKAFETFLTNETLQLLTLIATNRDETEEIHRDIDQLKQMWNRLDNEVKLCEKRFYEANLTSKIVNEKIREQKTFIYEQTVHPNLLTEILSALDKCSSRFSELDNEIEPKERKAMGVFLGKFRSLLNEIQMISFDLEQLKDNDKENPDTVVKVNQRWEKLFNEVKEKFDRMKAKQNFIEDFVSQLDQIDEEISKSSIYTKFSLVIERLEQLGRQIEPKKTQNEFKEYFQRFVEVFQRAKRQNEKFIELKQSLDAFDRLAVKFVDWLTETERYLNSRKTISRRFGLLDILLKQIDEHQTIENQVEFWTNSFTTLSQLATNLLSNLSKFDSSRIRHSFNSIETRWHRVTSRINERHKDLQKVLENAKKMIRPMTEDIDRIRSEVNRQTSLCQCSKKYDVEQIAEGRYRFGETQSLRLVRILRSNVMVRVGGGWTSLDEFLARHDPCRGRISSFEDSFDQPKGRTNYELHPEVYALRDGVAQTMSLFKSKLSNGQRSSCLVHPAPTPIRPLKDRSRLSTSSNGELSVSADDLSFSSQLISENDLKPSRIPIPIAMSTPAPSTISRTSSRESLLSEQSISSASSLNHRKASRLPIAVSRQKKNVVTATSQN